MAKETNTAAVAETQDVAQTETVAAANNALVALLEKDKVKAIRAKLGDRTFFVSDDESSAFDKATKHIETVALATDTFYGLPVLTREGPETDHITDAKRICIATLGTRDKATSTNGYKAIIAFAAPAPEDFMTDESDAAKLFCSKLIEREASDVAFQTLRAADTLTALETAVFGMPATVADIVTTSRESGGLDTDAFDAVWQLFRVGVLRVKVPKVEAALPQKPEVIKSLRSAAYARANPKCSVLEDAGMWVKIGNSMIKAAASMLDSDGKPMNIDMSTVQDWLDNRDSLVIGFAEAKVEAADLAGIDF